MASSFLDEGMMNLPVEVAEVQAHGSISGRVYSAYLTAGGGCCHAIFVFFMCISAQAFASGGDYWITYWYAITFLILFLTNPRHFYIDPLNYSMVVKAYFYVNHNHNIFNIV